MEINENDLLNDLNNDQAKKHLSSLQSEMNCTDPQYFYSGKVGTPSQNDHPSRITITPMEFKKIKEKTDIFRTTDNVSKNR